MEVSGLDELMLSMQQVAEIPDDVANEMLQAGGAAVKEAQQRNIKSSLRGDKVAGSVTVTPKLKTRDGGKERFVTVYPQGIHHTYNHKGKQKNATNAEVLFVHEYGAPKRNISAKGIVRKANEESSGAAVDAEYQVYDNWLKSKGL